MNNPHEDPPRKRKPQKWPPKSTDKWKRAKLVAPSKFKYTTVLKWTKGKLTILVYCHNKKGKK